MMPESCFVDYTCSDSRQMKHRDTELNGGRLEHAILRVRRDVYGTLD